MWGFSYLKCNFLTEFNFYTLNTCFFGCSLKTCTFLCLVFYLIVSVYRFANGVKKFNEYNFLISSILELRHVVWSVFLVLGIYGIYAGKETSFLEPCLWIQAIDLVETVTDYIGFVCTKTIIIPSFGNSKKRFDDTYVRDLIIFSFIVALFVFLWIVVYSCYKAELLIPAMALPENVIDQHHHHSVPSKNGFHRLEYSSYF